MRTTKRKNRLRKRILHAKHAARSELSDNDWSSAEYCKTFDDMTYGLNLDNIERVDSLNITDEEFNEKYAARCVPVLITGLTDSWPAKSRWNILKLLRKYRNQRFKCGEDDDGHSVKLKMKYFVEYMQNTDDDSPLYIFDSTFGERRKVKRLLDDYSVPQFFTDDLFGYACEERRPPYRWFVMGPPRSGTGIHVDPLGTSAWNALLMGRKKWCFFHPHTPKNILKPTKEEGGIHPDEAVTWFATVHKRISSPSWPKEWEPIEAVQHPGEVIFVPSGWWHVVLNLTETVAVTQNFCSKENLSFVCAKTLKGRPRFCKHWLKRLSIARPDVLPIIDAVMKAAGGDLAQHTLTSSSDSSSSTTSDSESENSDERNQYCSSANVYEDIPTGNVSLTKKRKISEECDSYTCSAKVRRSPA